MSWSYTSHTNKHLHALGFSLYGSERVTQPKLWLSSIFWKKWRRHAKWKSCRSKGPFSATRCASYGWGYLWHSQVNVVYQRRMNVINTYGTPPPVVYSSSEGDFVEVSSCNWGPLNRSKEKSAARLTASLASWEWPGVAASKTKHAAADKEENNTIVSRSAGIQNGFNLTKQTRLKAPGFI